MIFKHRHDLFHRSFNLLLQFFKVIFRLKVNVFIPCLELLIIKSFQKMLSSLIHIDFWTHFSVKTTRMNYSSEFSKKLLNLEEEISLDFPFIVLTFHNPKIFDLTVNTKFELFFFRDRKQDFLTEVWFWSFKFWNSFSGGKLWFPFLLQTPDNPKPSKSFSKIGSPRFSTHTST